MENGAVIIAAICLAGAAGLNAWIPLVLVLTMAQAGFVSLGWPLDAIGTGGLFGVLVPLAMAQMGVSKISGASRADGPVQMVLRPASAVAIILAMAPAGPMAWVAIVGAAGACGLVLAERAVRPMVAEATYGIGVPVMSTLQDLVAAVLTIAAVLSPLLALAFAGVSGYLCYRAYRRMRARWRMLQANAARPAVAVAAVRVDRGLACGATLAKVPEGESGSVTL